MYPQPPHRPRRHPARGPLGRLLTHPLLAGTLALLWLLLRSGRKPSRLAYPCQQAALGSVTLALGVALVPWAWRAGAWIARRRTRLAVTAAALLAVVLGGLSDTSLGQSRSRRGAQPPSDYRADVYVVQDVGGPDGVHHRGLDTLLECMGAAGRSFYRSATPRHITGPDGLVGAEDVVLVKVNEQWPERGGTSTDVLKGLIARVLEHPDGFRGEVVVVENGQGRGSFDWAASNAVNPALSVRAVVDGFAALGLPVSACLWDDVRATRVTEYADGDMRDGYVLDAWDAGAQLSVSYPKFRTAGGRYVSLRHGVWDPATSSYDDSRLRFLCVPVLKCHSIYGVTGAVKLHVGTMTTSLGTNTHNAVAAGGIGAFLARVRMPDLSILDCTWILADPGAGPACTYGQATWAGVLAASRDPIALDRWAVANVLVPAFAARGYTRYPAQDPEDPTSTFRSYLDLTADRLLAAGIPVTGDAASIDVHIRQGAGTPPGAGTVAPGPRPNPFTSGTVFRFVPRRSGAARLEVYDLGGRLRRRIETVVQADAPSEIPWDGRDGSGRPVGPGTYCYRVTGAGAALAGKVTRLR